MAGSSRRWPRNTPQGPLAGQRPSWAILQPWMNRQGGLLPEYSRHTEGQVITSTWSSCGYSVGNGFKDGFRSCGRIGPVARRHSISLQLPPWNALSSVGNSSQRSASYHSYITSDTGGATRVCTLPVRSPLPVPSLSYLNFPFPSRSFVGTSRRSACLGSSLRALPLLLTGSWLVLQATCIAVQLDSDNRLHAFKVPNQ